METLDLVDYLPVVATTWFPVLADAAIKGLAILSITALISLTLKKASAATRHMVWLLGTSSLVMLPALSAVLPGWHVLPRLSDAPASPIPDLRLLERPIYPRETSGDAPAVPLRVTAPSNASPALATPHRQFSW